jgi:hypothetical protein
VFVLAISSRSRRRDADPCDWENLRP